MMVLTFDPKRPRAKRPKPPQQLPAVAAPLAAKLERLAAINPAAIRWLEVFLDKLLARAEQNHR